MIHLPLEFTEKMKGLLGEEYEAFLASYGQPRKFGLRVNTLKITTEEFERIAPFHLTKISWVENGYYYEEEDHPARHPFYFAGLYYLQEPSAMTPASVLPVHPGERVLDLCAAPGGKATELGAKLRGKGLLVANDISASRAKALLKNIEVSGIANAFVTNETPARLAECFPEFFDKILVDAPCSGEGMFRKDPAVAKVWDAQKPLACAKQQREIVRRAAEMLAPGGMLLYSTCTFSPEENEQIIAGLLSERQDMELVDVPWYEGFAHGMPEAAAQRKTADLCADARGSMAGGITGVDVQGSMADGITGADGQELRADLRKCVRIFPHQMAGEGHFLALLKKMDGGLGAESRSYGAQPKDAGNFARGASRKKVKAGRSDENKKKAVQQYSKCDASGKILEAFLEETSADMDEKRLEIRKEQAYYVPENLDGVSGLSFLRNGLYLGEVKKGRFEPSQSFAMAIGGDSFARTISLDWRDERVLRYLKGETIHIDAGECALQSQSAKDGGKGWCLVCVNGYPLGWGKLADGILKNKYHAGWRIKERTERTQ